MYDFHRNYYLQCNVDYVFVIKTRSVIELYSLTVNHFRV